MTSIYVKELSIIYPYDEWCSFFGCIDLTTKHSKALDIKLIL